MNFIAISIFITFYLYQSIAGEVVHGEGNINDPSKIMYTKTELMPWAMNFQSKRVTCPEVKLN